MQGKILSDAVACGFQKPVRIPEFVLVSFCDFFVAGINLTAPRIKSLWCSIP
jgi:hypothetical protein